ncbi:hypothetical protein Tco_1569792 [Tanacetum coccineum]
MGGGGGRDVYLRRSSNKNMLSLMNLVKEILLKFNLPDHRILKDGGEVKEPQERCNIKAFQDNISRKVDKSVQKVTSSQDRPKLTDANRDNAVDDLMVFKLTISHSINDKGTSYKPKVNRSLQQITSYD